MPHVNLPSAPVTGAVSPDSPPFGCPHLRLVFCHGDDATTFLHGQLSNDVEGMGTGQVRLNGYLNPKGRMIATLYLGRLGENRFAIILADDLADAVLKRLRMYVLRAKVTFTASEHKLSGCAGHPGFGFDAVEKGGIVESQAGELLANLGNRVDRYLLMTATAPSREPDSGDGRNHWDLLAITDGVVEVGEAGREKLLPQAANLDLAGGVNFRKGCYPGQEIVARLRYLGKLKQRTLGFSADAKVGPDQAVFEGERKIGTVVVTASVSADACHGLMSINFRDIDWSALRSESGTALAAWLPPYEIPELSEAEND